MALKLKFVIISTLFAICVQTKYADAHCQLEHMKKYALHACEMLIDALEEHPDSYKERHTREIANRIARGNYYDEHRHVRPTHLRIHVNGFPAGGHIVVDRVYAKVLKMTYPSRFHVIPKSLFTHQKDGTTRKHHDKQSDFNETSNDVELRRHKRQDHHSAGGVEGFNHKVNFTYCCVNTCKPYDLCEL